VNRRSFGRLALTVVLLGIGVIVAFGTMLVLAKTGNVVMMATTGEDGIVAFDEPVGWNLLMAGNYLVGALVGLATFVALWRRLVGRRRS
jgi:uncharacterized BrkB/YihY/UPF0761 family membrane protein